MPQTTAGAKPSRFLALASIGVVAAGLYVARDVMIPIAVALLFTFLLTPPVHRLEQVRVPRVAAVLITVIFSFCILSGIGWLISNEATDLAIKVSSYQGDIEHKIQNLHRRFGHGALAHATQSIEQMAKDVASSQPSEIPISTQNQQGVSPVPVEIKGGPETSSPFSFLGDLLQFVAPLGRSVIVIVFVIFMLMQREDIRDRVIRLMGHGRLSVTTRALDDAATRISHYLLAESGINAVFGLVIGTGLYFIGIPNAPLWGLLCALLRFVPYLGIWIGAVFPITLSFVVPEGYYAARPFLTIGLFAVVEFVAVNVAEPLLFSSSTGISRLAILVAAVFWTWLWGPIGLLLSTPLTVLLAVAGKYVPQLEFLDVLLGDQPVLSPPERYYQRLLAEDSEEAEDLVEEFEKTHTPVETYTRMMLPALQMMERDFNRHILDEADRNMIAQVIRDQSESPHESTAPTGTPAVPKDCCVRIACVPAHGVADEIAGIMLVNLLNRQGYSATSVTTGALASEMVNSISSLNADLVVVSAMPPAALSHARYLCKKIRAKFPEIHLLVGIWNAQGNLDRLQKRLTVNGSLRIAAQFDDALATIHQMVQPQLIQPEEPANATAHAN